MGNPNIPVGISDFKEIRENNNYYIDKSGFISELLTDGAAKVTLITRPRRFGKTLGMSMLYYFFNVRNESQKLFEGLEISRNHELCEKWLNKWPTIFLTFKDIDGLDFASAYDQLVFTISDLYQKYSFLLESEEIDEEDRKRFKLLKSGEGSKILVIRSLSLLMRLLENYYHKQMILLIDEYDVPIAKASSKGYYQQMLEIIRGMMSTALKDNTSLKFAVITGCLQIAKESIFTGTNNFVTDTIANTGFNEYFGFTQQEVNKILEDTGTVQYAKQMKEWYDGYHMGEIDVYCPWDVVNYVDLLKADPKAKPRAFWINTSGNDLVKRFVDKADKTTQGEIERLINGEAIEKNVRSELTYNEIDDSIDNLWSVLFTTGYLTQDGETDDGKLRLVIPNREVREVFILQIQEWFRKTFVRDDKPMRDFCQAFQTGDAETIQKHLNLVMTRMISILDTKARDDQNENFYHGLLLGLLRSDPTWLIMSNVESGDGFSDILIEPDDPDAGIIIEVKYSPTFAGLDEACKKALEQVKTRRYDEKLRNEGRENLITYGIAFNRKRCKAVCEKL